MQDSKEKETQAQTSYIGAQQSYITAEPNFMHSSIQNSQIHPRAQTRSPQSRYRHIPTVNMKFEKFIDLIFNSKMKEDDIKTEIIGYMQVLETHYTQAIKDLRAAVDRQKLKAKKANFEKVSEVSQKAEMEQLFVECIEEIRKEIMKRRLKNEIQNRKKFHHIDQNSNEAKEFEQSLLKLAQLAKSRVKFSEFTNKDKYHLMDLFVNNEKTLLKIYEILFPHRASGPVGGSALAQSIGANFGQDPLRGMSRGSVRISQNSQPMNGFNSSQITEDN